MCTSEECLVRKEAEKGMETMAQLRDTVNTYTIVDVFFFCYFPFFDW